MAAESIDWRDLAGSALRLGLSVLQLPGAEVISSVQDLTKVLAGSSRHGVNDIELRARVKRIQERQVRQLLEFDEFDEAVPRGERTQAAESVKAVIDRSGLSYEDLERADFDPRNLEPPLVLAIEREMRSRVVSANGMQYGRRLLGILLAQVIAIARSTPRFEDERTMVTYLAAKHSADTLYNGLQDVFIPALRHGASAEHAEFLAKYMAEVNRRYGRVELFGLSDVPPSLRTAPLSMTYISLSTTRTFFDVQARQLEEVTDTLALGRAHGDPRLGSVEDALAQLDNARRTDRGIRLIISGTAGSGKTTVLQWIATRLALATQQETDIPNGIQQLAGKTPILVKLRSAVVADSPRLSVDDLLDVVAPASERPGGWLIQNLVDGRAVLLFDGLDELTEPRQIAARTWIESIGQAYEKVDIVVTTRPEALDTTFISRMGYSSVTMRPMDEDQRESAIRQWFDAQCMPVRPDLAAVYRERESSLLQTLRHDTAVQDLCATPLLAAMLCAYFAAGSQTIVTNRLRLVQGVVEVLVDGRERARGTIPAHLLGFSLSQKMDLLSQIALHLYGAGANTFRVVGRNFGAFRKIRVDGEELQFEFRDGAVPLDLALGYLVLRSNIVRPISSLEAQFVHKLFLEYSAAYGLLERGNLEGLVATRSLPGWYSVVSCFAYLAPNFLTHALITALIEVTKSATNGVSARRLAFALAESLGHANSYTEELYSEVTSILLPCLPPRTDEEVTHLASLGENALSLLPAPGTAAEALAYLRTAALVRGRGALAFLRLIAGGEFGEQCRSELVQVWLRFDPEDYASLVLSQLDWRGHSLFVPSVAAAEAVHCVGPVGGLELGRCDGMQDLLWLRGVSGVRTLDLDRVAGITSLEGADALPNTRRMRLPRQAKLTSIAPIDQAKELRFVWIPDCGPLQDLTPLSRLAHLERLDIGNAGPAAVGTLSGCTSLRSLTIHGSELSSSQFLSEMSSLRSIELDAVEESFLENAPSFARLEKLRLVTSGRAKATGSERNRLVHLIDVAIFGSALVSVDLTVPSTITVALRNLGAQTALRTAKLVGPLSTLTNGSSTSPSETWYDLKRDEGGAFNLGELVALQDLRELYIWENPFLSSLEGVLAFKHLSVLDCRFSPIESLSGRDWSVEDLGELRHLCLDGCTSLANLGPAMRARRLVAISLKGIGDRFMVDDFVNARPDVDLQVDPWLFQTDAS